MYVCAHTQAFFKPHPPLLEKMYMSDFEKNNLKLLLEMYLRNIIKPMKALQAALQLSLQTTTFEQ